VAYATQLLDILATRPDLHTLRVTLPANTACITALADLPGLRHLHLTLFHPQPLPGGGTDPVIDLSAPKARQELLGAVLGAIRQVTHLTLEHPEMHLYSGGHTPVPPQLQQCTQLQVFSSKTITLTVHKPEHWTCPDHWSEVSPCLELREAPPAGTTMPDFTEALLVPDRLDDLGPMLAALPDLETARVVLKEYIDMTHGSGQVSPGRRGAPGTKCNRVVCAV
jgi:hypothetical protein